MNPSDAPSAPLSEPQSPPQVVTELMDAAVALTKAEADWRELQGMPSSATFRDALGVVERGRRALTEARDAVLAAARAYGRMVESQPCSSPPSVDKAVGFDLNEILSEQLRESIRREAER